MILIIQNILTTGTNTSSATAEWAMAKMIRNPRVMQKAQDEVRKAAKGKKRVHETDIQ